MSEYKAEAWRISGYYPGQYAKSMAALGIGIDYSDDDYDRYEAEFLADIAAHDADVRKAALEEARRVVLAYPSTHSEHVASILYERAAALGDAPTTKQDAGEVSDGYHTFNELYKYRMLYNAHAALGWITAGYPVVKSWRHSDGELCFGGGWFIVSALLPSGQVTNHYEAVEWSLFAVPEVDHAPEWDGHTPADAATRLRAALTTKEN